MATNDASFVLTGEWALGRAPIHALGIGCFGAAAAGIHAVLAIRFKVNQIVSGVAINIFAVGATSFISSRFLDATGIF